MKSKIFLAIILCLLYALNTNVGIGTTTPQERLTISADRYKISSSDSYDYDFYAGGIGGISGIGSVGQVTFWTGANTVSGNNSLFWNNSNNRLGIGTTNPGEKLHVIGNAKVDGTLFANNISSNSPLSLQTFGTTRLYIGDSGNIGIGTINPMDKLDIRGGIAINGSQVINISGSWVGDPTGLTGPQGPQGLQGPIGPAPAHEWSGTSLRFQNPDATWGSYTNLQGPQGPQGLTGPQGPPGPTVSTSAVCGRDCSCTVTVDSPCTVTSDTGSCSFGVTGFKCCVCRFT